MANQSPTRVLQLLGQQGPAPPTDDGGPVVSTVKELVRDVRGAHRAAVSETRSFYAFSVRKTFSAKVEELGFKVPDGLPHAAHRKPGPGGLEYDCLVRVLSLEDAISYQGLIDADLSPYTRFDEPIPTATTALAALHAAREAAVARVAASAASPKPSAFFSPPTTLSPHAVPFAPPFHLDNNASPANAPTSSAHGMPPFKLDRAPSAADAAAAADAPPVGQVSRSLHSSTAPSTSTSMTLTRSLRSTLAAEQSTATPEKDDKKAAGDKAGVVTSADGAAAAPAPAPFTQRNKPDSPTRSDGASSNGGSPPSAAKGDVFASPAFMPSSPAYVPPFRRGSADSPKGRLNDLANSPSPKSRVNTEMKWGQPRRPSSDADAAWQRRASADEQPRYGGGVLAACSSGGVLGTPAVHVARFSSPRVVVNSPILLAKSTALSPSVPAMPSPSIVPKASPKQSPFQSPRQSPFQSPRMSPGRSPKRSPKSNPGNPRDPTVAVEAFGEAKTTRRLIILQCCLGLGRANVGTALDELNERVAALKKVKHRVVFACLAMPVKGEKHVELLLDGQSNRYHDLQELWQRRRLVHLHAPNPLERIERSITSLEQCGEALRNDAAHVRLLTNQLSGLVGRRLTQVAQLAQSDADSNGGSPEPTPSDAPRGGSDEVIALSTDVQELHHELVERVQRLESRLGVPSLAPQRTRAYSQPQIRGKKASLSG